jgi:hypothetical protein
MSNSSEPKNENQYFSLVLGGPFFQLLLKTKLSGNIKRKGIIQYGQLGSEYVTLFESKWLNKIQPEDEALIGNADIQSLADLSNSYDIIREMQVSPITKKTILTLAAMTLMPVLPLTLTLMPLEELAKKLFEILL